MVRIASIVTALMATVSSVAAANCPAPYDICGWALVGQYGYAPETIYAAAAAAGQSLSDDAVHGSIFHCLDGGAIAWAHTCPNARCNPPDNGALPNHNCAA